MGTIKGYFITISRINPIRFIQKETIWNNHKLAPDYQALYSTMYNAYKYVQKFAINDLLKFQFSYEKLSDLNYDLTFKAELKDLNGNVYQELDILEVEGDFNTSGIRVFEVEKLLTSTYQSHAGGWFVDLTFTFTEQELIDPDSFTVSFISEPFNVRASNSQLFKFEYYNSKNLINERHFFEIEKNAKNKYCIRAEIGKNYLPKLVLKNYADQKMSQYTADSERYRHIELKNIRPLPSWLIEKLYFCISLNEVYMNGQQIAIVSNDDIEYLTDFETAGKFKMIVAESDMKLFDTPCIYEPILDRE